MKPREDPPPSQGRDELEREVDRLQRDVKRLKLEQDILKKANELLKKELGIDQQLLTNREKTQLVDALRSAHALPDLLAERELARSSYFPTSTTGDGLHSATSTPPFELSWPTSSKATIAATARAGCMRRSQDSR